MGGAQRIVAHLLEHLELPLLCSVVESRAQAPEVMVVALVIIIRFCFGCCSIRAQVDLVDLLSPEYGSSVHSR